MENKQEIANSALSKDVLELIPDELWLKIANEADDVDDINALNSTCSFFSFNSKNETFKKDWLTIKQNKLPILCVQGLNHTLIYINKTLLVSGDNSFGALGLGHNKVQKTFIACKPELKFGERVTQLAAGTKSSYLLTNHNRMLACGLNNYGQLGLGDTQNKDTFTECTIHLNPGESIKLLAAGSCHVLLLTNQNRILVCGDNSYGQLGVGHNYSMTFMECPLKLHPGEIPIKIIPGAYNSLITTNQNRLLACGFKAGLLCFGDSSWITIFTPCSFTLPDESMAVIGAGNAHFLVLTSQKKLWVCGLNHRGQLGLDNYDEQLSFVECKPDLGQDGSIVAVGAHYKSSNSFLISNKVCLFVCGDAREYGLSLEQSTFAPIKLTMQGDEEIKFVACGHESTLVVTNQKRIYVCGSNMYGQLGLGKKQSQPASIELVYNRQKNTLIEKGDTANDENALQSQSCRL